MKTIFAFISYTTLFRTTVAGKKNWYSTISGLFSGDDDYNSTVRLDEEIGGISMEELYKKTAHDKHDLIMGYVIMTKTTL